MAQAELQDGGKQRRDDIAEEALRRRERWFAGQKDAFQAAMDGQPLAKCLSILIRTALEEVDNDRRCAFYIANAARTELHHVVGMPDSYARAVDGFKVGVDSLACGLAAAQGQPVITRDVTEEPCWKPWLHLARDYDFRACWSFPVETSAGKVVGTFAMYFREPREPTLHDRELVASLTHSASIIISHHQQVQERAHAELALAAQRILRESDERFRNLANFAPVMLWMAGRDALCEFVNQGWVDFSGRSLEQEIGTGWTETLHPDDLEHHLNTCKAAFAAPQPFKVESRFKRHDGQYRWIEIVGVPRFAPDAEFLGFVGVGADITDHKQAREIELNLGKLQRLAAIGELTAAIAHEVRQPLAAIRANALAVDKLLAAANPSPDELHEAICDILADNDRAEAILRRIRDFSLKREVQRTRLDITSIITDTIRLLALDAQKRRIPIDTQLEAAMPAIMGDRTQLQQVLVNLIINAMDAMEDTLPSSRQITVDARLTGGTIGVMVTDGGLGIDQAHLSRVFESFFTTKHHGMGLGLSIAKSIIERHGGSIWAKNNPEGGASFGFALPIAPAVSAVLDRS
jgi:PAS domain S-box-containing protein